MAKWMGILMLLFFCSCGGDSSLSGDSPVEAKDFIGAFPKMKLPTTIYDTSLARIGDSTTISRVVFSQFIPDSALQQFIGSDKKPAINPVGKIESENETYLLAKLNHNKKTALAVFVLDAKQKYLGAKQLVSTNTADGYVHSVSINREPTYTISREKITKDNQLLYTRTGFAYNKDAGFMIVVNDGNEDPRKQDSIINPIDTFARNNPLSGDYIKDKKNFLSIRDGRNANTYMFFVHFEKNSGACIGELKGEMVVKDESSAQYTANGDPCVINFKISGNRIQMKEEGTCGNHRDIKCFFDDSYARKKEQKPKAKRK